MSQHDGNIANGAGAVVRADINAALVAIMTNNSGAKEPAAPYANMWWYDTSTATLKRRNNANDAWIIMGLEAADIDGTLAANSDSKVPTQKAVKTYVDAKTIAENRLSLSDNTTANASTSAHGLLKKLSNVATEFMNGVGNWVAVTIDALLPSQTGNSGKFLTTNGSASSWGAVPNSPQFTAGDFPLASSYADTQVWSNVTTPTLVKSLVLSKGGQLRIKFTLSRGGGDNANGQIYRNGVAVGTQRSYNGAGLEYSEDISGWSIGDTIGFYLWVSGAHDGQYAHLKNVKISTLDANGISGGDGINGIIFKGTGVPNAALGAQGDLYLRTDNLSPTTCLYVKTDATTWTAK